MKPEAKRTCQVCGASISTGIDLCPVCAFRRALSDNLPTSEFTVDMAPSPTALRFEHYEVLTEDGEPYELGRGAMGVTYKALDVELRCPVALKLINARYLGDESVRLRFLREARPQGRSGKVAPGHRNAGTMRFRATVREELVETSAPLRNEESDKSLCVL